MKRLIGIAGLRRRVARAARRSAQQITVKIGVLTDMSSLYADVGGPGSVAAAKMAVADFMPDHPGREGRDRQRRPPEQARRRLQHRQPVVRRRQGRHDRRRAELRRRARGQPRSRSEKNKVFIGLRRRPPPTSPARSARQHRALDLRHLDARQRHRQGDGEDRRRHLVLPHRRLRLRPCARARHRGGGRGERRQGARRASAIRSTTSDFSSFLLQAQASKAKVIGLANAGGDTINSIKQARRVRHRQGRAEASPACWCSSSDVDGARPADRAGPGADRDLLLGPERRAPAPGPSAGRPSGRASCRP